MSRGRRLLLLQEAPGTRWGTQGDRSDGRVATQRKERRTDDGLLACAGLDTPFSHPHRHQQSWGLAATDVGRYVETRVQRPSAVTLSWNSLFKKQNKYNGGEKV